MPRFVLLYHECPPAYAGGSHWDFMLEVGDTLRTWAIKELPAEWRAVRLRTEEFHAGCAPTATGNEVEAEQLDEHRREYLDYEGPVSGDRGHVVRIDGGTYTTESESPQCWRLTLAGQHLRGTIVLQPASSGQLQWTLWCAPRSSLDNS